MTGGQLVQFIFYAVHRRRRRRRAVAKIWGDLQRAAGASERLMELLHDEAGDRARRRIPWRSAAPARGAVAFENVTFRYPSRPDFTALERFLAGSRAGRGGGAGRAVAAPANPRCSSCCCASSRRRTARSPSTASTSPMLDPVELRRNIAVVAQDPVIFSGTHRRQHPLWPPRRERRRCAPRRRGRRRRRIHRTPAAGLSTRWSASAA